MIRIIAKYEITIEGKTFTALMDHDTSLPIAKEMAFALLTHLGNVQEQAKAAQSKVDAEAQTSSDVPSDPPPDVTPVTEETNVE